MVLFSVRGHYKGSREDGLSAFLIIVFIVVYSQLTAEECYWLYRFRTKTAHASVKMSFSSPSLSSALSLSACVSLCLSFL